jgi:hypothetical protein
LTAGGRLTCDCEALDGDRRAEGSGTGGGRETVGDDRWADNSGTDEERELRVGNGSGAEEKVGVGWNSW